MTDERLEQAKQEIAALPENSAIRELIMYQATEYRGLQEEVAKLLGQQERLQAVQFHTKELIEKMRGSLQTGVVQ